MLAVSFLAFNLFVSRAFSDQAAGSSKIQVIVKEFPDYEESFDN